MLTTITKEMRTETAHRLTNYNGRCAHMHGHSYLWRVTAGALGGDMDSRGMVMDFKDLKEAMMHVLDPWDHALILHDLDPLVLRLGAGLMEVLEPTSNPWTGEVRDAAVNAGRLPPPPRLFVYPWNPTAERMAQWVAGEVQQYFTSRKLQVRVCAVECWETTTSYARWVDERAFAVCDQKYR